MKLGRFKLHIVGDGTFRLDGGAMFGVVPRVLWQKVKPPDDRNRILMGTNCLLIDDGEQPLLIDTGIGDKNDDRFADMFGLDPEAIRLPQALREAGYETEQVRHVVSTHLHFDHCGWHTRFGADGESLKPTFTQARYWLEQGELEHARRPLERDKASYDSRNWEPLFEAGAVELFDTEAEPRPGIKVIKAPGHNADMCIVLIDGGEGARAVFWADLVPTAAHVAVPWVMGFDLYPVETMTNKRAWLPRAADGGWLCIFEHDPEVPLGHLYEKRPGRYAVRPLDAAASSL